MEKFFFICRVFLLVIFFALIYFVVQYADVIRSVIASQFFTSKKAVAGAQTNFEKEIKKDIHHYALQAKEKISDIKIGDVVYGFSRTAKIAKDVNGIKEYVISEINSLLER